MTMLKNRPVIVLLLLLLFLCQACATGNKPSRGKLSNAMEKASDKYEGPRRIEVPDDDRYQHVPDERRAKVKKRRSSRADLYQEDQDETGINPFGFSGGVGFLKSDDFSEMFNLGLSAGTNDRNSRLELYLGGSWAGLDHTGELDASIDNGVFLYNIGFNYKRKVSDDPKWNTPYFLVGAAYQRMFWRYNNSLTTSGGDIITSDSLEGIEIHAGFGQNLLKVGGNNFGIEIVPAVIFWLPETTEGFDNDVFDPFVMIKVQAVFSNW